MKYKLLTILFFVIGVFFFANDASAVITAGNYTLGLDGDENYSSWAAFWNDLGNLTGDITLTVDASAFTEDIAAAHVTESLGGFTLKVTPVTFPTTTDGTTGARFTYNVADHFLNMQMEGAGSIIIEGIVVLEGTSKPSFVFQTANINTSFVYTFRKNIIKGGNNGIYWADDTPTYNTYNNILYNQSNKGIYSGTNLTGFISNNTIVDTLVSSCGIETAFTGLIDNNLVYLGGISDFYLIGTAATGNNNSSYDASADDFFAGANNRINKTTSPFTSYATDDFTLAAGSDPIGNGKDLSASFTTDFFGNTRSVPWDIGAVEYVVPPGITVTPTSGLTTTEAGATTTFTMVLDTQPTADVIIGLSSSDTTEGTVSPSSLTFTNANWNTPQTVTLTGVDDSVDDGNIAYTIVTAAASSADLGYNGINASDVSATNTDNDTAGVTVTPTAGLGDSTHDDNINKEAVPATPKKTDLNPQGDFSILVNGGAEYTNSRTVKLKLFAGSDTKYMLVSENPNFSGAVQEKYVPDKSWTLSRGDGKKTIYTKFLTLYDVASEVVSDSIILDTSAPSPPIVTNPKNYSAIQDNTPTITGTAEPDASIILELNGQEYYSTETDTKGNWDYTSLSSLKDQDYTLKVTAQDQAGNLSKVQTIHFKIQTQKVSLVPGIPALSLPISPPSKEEEPTPTEEPQIEKPFRSEGPSGSERPDEGRITPPPAEKPEQKPTPEEQEEPAPPPAPEKQASVPPLDIQPNIPFLESSYGNISLKPASSEAPLTLVSGQTLKSFVKPIKPVKAIKVMIIFQKPAERDTSYETKNNVLSSILGIPSAQAQTWRIAEYTLTDENNDGIYEGDITLPETTGTYLIRTTLFYVDGTIENLDTETLIDPKGYVYTETKDGLEARIKDAQISLYAFNSEKEEFELWAAQSFDQENPQIADKTGEYEFLVPEGKYYLQITAKGYQSYKSEEFQAQEGDVIHQNIELAPVKKFDLKWLILPGIIMMVLVGGVGIGVWRKRKG